MSLCIKVFGIYDFLNRLNDCDELFWFGGQPGIGSPEASNYTGALAEDLGSLAQHDPKR
ncbi:hypothetical protein PC129_g19921 [Phytophthora cactorum]|uniref:Uncharacterized protein n=1 Tax=Phytophthora cactorum TaxID=29920 RepID=A0A329SIB0_9STRA|nr:hypothetical protein Pcac1_g22000 [Phytophthora cactorum]KAG2799679.1 hypothetical protein PC111_g20324 [Phytophthora cactorum]KAG2832391.1 hypothetical protein PC113_g20757 [Phytophthora cactorum]KAG2886724.1 hypothetical protein PC115_g20587 [Phytophthora cactorum]KAG2897276.1 hypothetical protein PC117_g22819 [Phytophthora cactorum]